MKTYTKSQRILLHIIGFVIGIAVGALTLFQIFFLAKVIPHGGI